MLNFLPDADTTTPEVLVAVSNAAPTLRGYEGFATGLDLGLAAVSAPVTGAALIVSLNGTGYLFVGTDDTLQLGGSSWTDVSDGTYATGYNAGASRWRFAAEGKTALAISESVQLQKYVIGTDTDFAKVDNAPKARYMETAAGFVMLAYCDDTDTGLSTGYGKQEHRWWCSQIFNATGTWAPSVSTQATTGLLVSGPGPITGLARVGDNIALFKKTSVYIGSYVGPPEVWRWDRIPGTVGCGVQEAAISIGNAVIFVGEEDFYVLDASGSVPQSIGSGIREWFFNERLNRRYSESIFGIHDQINGRVLWSYPSVAQTSGTLDSVLIYDYRRQAWGHATLTVKAWAQAIQSGVIYKGTNSFDDAIKALNASATKDTYADIPAGISYNSQYFKSGSPVPAYVGSDDKVYLLTGQNASWSITTGDMGDADGVSLLRKVRPKWRAKPSASTLTHKHRMDLGDSLTVKSPVSINSDRFDLLHSSRWHSWTLSCTGDGEVEGFRADFAGAGKE